MVKFNLVQRLEEIDPVILKKCSLETLKILRASGTNNYKIVKRYFVKVLREVTESYQGRR